MVAGLKPPEPECGCRFERRYYEVLAENERLRPKVEELREEVKTLKERLTLVKNHNMELYRQREELRAFRDGVEELLKKLWG